MPAYTSELIAVKLNKKGSKVHIAFNQSYMAICGNRFGGRVNKLIKQEVQDIETINQILNDDQICSRCKKDVSDWLNTNFILEDTKAGLEKLRNLVKELEAENAKLKEPKGCNGCNHLSDNVCNHPGIPEFYTPQYINYSGCGLLESKAP